MPVTIEYDTMQGLEATALPQQMAQQMKTLASKLVGKIKKSTAAKPVPKKSFWTELAAKAKQKKTKKFWTKPTVAKAAPAPQRTAASSAAATAFKASANIAARMRERMQATKPKPVTLTQTGIRRAGAPSSFNLPRQIAGQPFPQRPRAVVPQSVQPPLPMMGTPPLRSAVAYESIAKLFSGQGAFVPAAPSEELIASLYGLDYPGQAFIESLSLPKKILLGAAAVGGLLAIGLLIRRMRRGGVSGIDAFTRKHYEEVAKILREGKASQSDIERWVERFQEDNPRFRADFFRAAVAGRKKDRSRH